MCHIKFDLKMCRVKQEFELNLFNVIQAFQNTLFIRNCNFEMWITVALLYNWDEVKVRANSLIQNKLDMDMYVFC